MTVDAQYTETVHEREQSAVALQRRPSVSPKAPCPWGAPWQEAAGGGRAGGGAPPSQAPSGRVPSRRAPRGVAARRLHVTSVSVRSFRKSAQNPMPLRGRQSGRPSPERMRPAELPGPAGAVSPRVRPRDRGRGLHPRASAGVGSRATGWSGLGGLRRLRPSCGFCTLGASGTLLLGWESGCPRSPERLPEPQHGSLSLQPTRRLHPRRACFPRGRCHVRVPGLEGCQAEPLPCRQTVS